MGDWFWVKVPAPKMCDKQQRWSQNVVEGQRGPSGPAMGRELIQEIPSGIPTLSGFKDPDNEKTSEKGLEKGHRGP